MATTTPDVIIYGGKIWRKMTNEQVDLIRREFEQWKHEREVSDMTTPAIQGVTPDSDNERNMRVIIASEGESEGLQNLYSPVRLRSAPPTSLSKNKTGYAPIQERNPHVAQVGQNGEPRAKRTIHLGQVARPRTRTSGLNLCALSRGSQVRVLPRLPIPHPNPTDHRLIVSITCRRNRSRNPAATFRAATALEPLFSDLSVLRVYFSAGGVA